MSDTPANRMAGGPLAYIAATTSSLPALNGASITWSNNEVQTITPAGTWTSGTFTLEVTYASGSSETTAAIALTATAATIKTALAALNGLTDADLTVTGGPLNATGPVVPVVITFIGAYANTPMAMILINVTGIVGGGTATVAETTGGRLWTELPDVVKDVSVNYVYKAEDHTPAFAPHPTGSTTVSMGIDKIICEIEETDLDAFNLALASSLLVLTPAGASQVSLHTLTQPLPADVDAAIYQIALNFKGPQGSTGWGIVDHFFKVKRSHQYTVKAGAGSVRKIGLTFEVFADSTQSYRCHKAYEYIAVASS